MKWSLLVLFVAGMLMVAGGSVAQAATLDEGPLLDSGKDYYAVIHTSMGAIHVKMKPDMAPIAVRNFINLAEGTREFIDFRTKAVAKRPFYNGVIFHRVGPNFMIQGGDPTGTGGGTPGYSIEDEYGPNHIYDRGGLLAMARTALPNTGGSQFFLTEAPYHGLDTQYTIFGEVAFPEDIEIIKKIARVPLARRGQDGTGKPAKDVVIERVEVIRADKGAALDTVFKKNDKKVEAKPEETKKDDAKPEATKPAEKSEESSK